LKKIVLGTKNRGKLRELKSLLRGAKVRVLSLKNFPACRDVHENGRTFESNARKKAAFYSRHTKLPALADDSGLMVHPLNGKPGVYSARFAGSGCTYADNNRKLLRLLKGKKNRRAKFVSVIAVYDKGKFIQAVKGECRGRIAFEEKGKNGFGYDPVFIPDGFSKTFAELPPRIKNKISHRGRALHLAKKVILGYFKKK
jgi:XTP/dITP diphosphohydrolase